MCKTVKSEEEKEAEKFDVQIGKHMLKAWKIRAKAQAEINKELEMIIQDLEKQVKK